MIQFNNYKINLTSKIFLIFALLLMSLFSIGCSNENSNVKSFGKIEKKNHNLQGRLLPTPIAKNNVPLQTSDGEIFMLERDTQDKVVLLAVGYASCPDICPMHLSVLAGAYNNLPANMQRDTKIVFLSADPLRDQEKISSWTQQFHQDFIGVTSDEKKLVEFQNALKIPPAILAKETENSDNYAVSHASWITVFTKDNLAHFIYPLGITQKEWVADLEIIHKDKWKINN
ncbi:MAG: hypothetical protein CL872_05140 [Dehalococcoidaceae bacterium]|nr:hypothetical protein [Dehalococcoidaceae bacterium]